MVVEVEMTIHRKIRRDPSIHPVLKLEILSLDSKNILRGLRNSFSECRIKFRKLKINRSK